MTKILLIEENPSTCQMLSQQLNQHGYEVISSAEGGDQGILLAIKESPDVILVGSKLPVISGWQVIQILKASAVTQNIPTIVLMEPTVETDWSMVIKSDCNDYCLKPVDLKHLLGKLETWAGREAMASKSMNVGKLPTFRSLDLQQSPPLSQTPQTSLQGSQQNTTAQSSSKKALVVYIEDSQVDSQAMARIVQEVGHGYANIVDSLHALPQLLELKPQLIFLDLVMPVVNGYELCAQIRRISAFKATPIIIVTNNDGIADRVRARIVGASGFLGKPIKKQRVTKVIQRYLRSTPQVSLNETHQSDYLPTF